MLRSNEDHQTENKLVNVQYMVHLSLKYLFVSGLAPLNLLMTTSPTQLWNLKYISYNKEYRRHNVLKYQAQCSKCSLMWDFNFKMCEIQEKAGTQIFHLLQQFIKNKDMIFSCIQLNQNSGAFSMESYVLKACFVFTKKKTKIFVKTVHVQLYTFPIQN